MSENSLIAILAALREIEKQEARQKPFDKQLDFINDPSRYIAALCTRRAGKTTGIAKKIKNTMDSHPGSLCRYIALTRDSAKDIMWNMLQELNEQEKWDATFNESNLLMVLPNQSRLRLYGADMKNFIRRLRGVKSPATAIDEAQEFGEHINQLVDDIIVPSMADYKDGWIALTGTPGPIPRGLFYEITHENKYGYSNHKWSLFDNPFIPNAKEFIEDLKKRKLWDDFNPTFRREYKGEWVLDLESLLIRYTEDNHYDSLPNVPWVYILGVDVGHADADALALLGWSEKLPDIYLIEEKITTGQDITELSNQIQYFLNKYDISKIVMDTGGLGLKIAEEIRRRKHIPIEAADKKRKFENVAFLNDWLRIGRFKAKKDSRFAIDSYHVQIDYDKTTPDRIVVKKGFHSDIIDAVLYAFKESPAFTYQKPIPKPKPNTQEWYDKQVKDMEDAAEEYFNKLSEQPDNY